MKKWLALAWTIMLLVHGCALAEVAEQPNFTFEMFRSEVGLLYEGKWVSFDDAFCVYLPVTLVAKDLTDDQRASGIIACYSEMGEQDASPTVQIVKRNAVKTMEEITGDLSTFCAKVIPLRINGIPAVVGTDDCCMYAEIMLESGDVYRCSFRVSGNDDTIDGKVDEVRAMYAYEMLYSIATAPLAIEMSKAGTASPQNAR